MSSVVLTMLIPILLDKSLQYLLYTDCNVCVNRATLKRQNNTRYLSVRFFINYTIIHLYYRAQSVPLRILLFYFFSVDKVTCKPNNANVVERIRFLFLIFLFSFLEFLSKTRPQTYSYECG